MLETARQRAAAILKAVYQSRYKHIRTARRLPPTDGRPEKLTGMADIRPALADTYRGRMLLGLGAKLPDLCPRNSYNDSSRAHRTSKPRHSSRCHR